MSAPKDTARPTQPAMGPSSEKKLLCPRAQHPHLRLEAAWTTRTTLPPECGTALAAGGLSVSDFMIIA